MEAVRLRRLPKRVAGRPLSTRLDGMCYDRTLRKRSRRQKERKRPDPGCKSDSFVNCGLEEPGDDESTYEGEHSCVLYVEGKIVRQEGVYWPHYIFIPVLLMMYFFLLGYMVDSCRYKSRVIKGAAAIFADWHYNGASPPRFDPGAAPDGYGSAGRPCRLIFTLPQMQAPVMVTVQVQIPAGAPGLDVLRRRARRRRAGAGASAAGRGAGLDDLRASPAGAGPRAGRRRTGRAGRARGRRAVCQAMSRARSDARPAWVVRVPSRLESADQSFPGVWGL